MWHILTRARDIANHPDREIEYWLGVEGLDRQRRVERLTEVGNLNACRRAVL